MMIIAGKGQGKGLGAGIWYPGSYLFVSLLQTSSVKRKLVSKIIIVLLAYWLIGRRLKFLEMPLASYFKAENQRYSCFETVLSFIQCFYQLLSQQL
jgi:hypothetical protein